MTMLTHARCGVDCSKVVLRLVVPVLVCLATAANAANVNASSCSQSAVQSAINSASSGDTVLVPAGTCTWSTQVTIPANKGITLQGAGMGVTTINDGITSNHTLLVLLDSSAVLTRVTGFTFDSNGTSKSGELALISINSNVSGDGRLDRFRIDHISFDDLKTRGIIVWMRGTDLGGVIDNNTFNVNTDSLVQGMEIEGTSPQSGTPFSRPFTPGSAHAIYIEDNVFNFAYPNDGAYDAYTGARYVFRHNVVHNTIIGHHGADSGSGRGMATFEVYQNQLDANSGVNVSRIAFWRSGTGVNWGNTVTTSGGGSYSDSHLVLANYRSCGSYTYWGQCNGSNSWDQNVSGKAGYACLDQIGHYFTSGSGGSNLLKPLYVWDNTLNGNQLDAAVDSKSCSTLASHIQANRDYYNEVSGFDGTSGVGVGLLAARPANCTAGTGYWASDKNTLYQCTGNNWSVYYTPYTYPHPLRSGTVTVPPPAPTGLHVEQVQ